MTLWTKLFGVKCPYFHSVDKGVALTDVLRMNLKEKKQKKRSVKISPTAVWMINSIFFFGATLIFVNLSVHTGFLWPVFQTSESSRWRSFILNGTGPRCFFGTRRMNR